jgi:hypothetical protein
MMPYIVHGMLFDLDKDDDIDKMASPAFIESIPGYRGFFDWLANHRSCVEDFEKVGTFGKTTGLTRGVMRAMWSASMPIFLHMALEKKHGMEWFKTTHFDKWIASRPWFKMGACESKLIRSNHSSTPSSGTEIIRPRGIVSSTR